MISATVHERRRAQLSALLGWLSACLSGCGGAADRGMSEAGPSVRAAIIRDSAGLELVTVEVAAASLPEWVLDTVLVTIDGSSPDLSSVLEALWLSDGRIVIPDLSTNQLHVYGSSGAYQRSYGGSGDGPGEFRRIRSAMVAPGDTISVFDFTDGAGGTLQLYHPDEGFLQSVALPATAGAGSRLQGWSWGSGSYVGLLEDREPMTRVAPELHRWPTSSVLELFRGEAVAAPVVRFPGSYAGFHDSGMDVRLPFTHRPVVLFGSGRLLYGTGQRFELLELDPSFALRRIIRWPSMREPLEDEDLEQARSEWLAPREEAADPESLRMILDVMFAPELLPENRPAIGKALFDDEGRIWVARFEPFVFVETLYYVLEPNGEPLAQLRIPAEKRALLSGVRDDHVLLAGKDAFDVPKIEVVRIRKP